MTSCSNNQAVFATSAQTGSTTYTVAVSTSVKDANGNPMASGYPFSYTTQAVSNNAPVLSWASAGCLTEGVRPRTGPSGGYYEFRVVYADAEGACPSYINVVVNGNTYALGNNDGASCQTGRTYYQTVTINTVGDLNYYFTASDGTSQATGIPTGNHVVSAITALMVKPGGTSPWYGTIASAIAASGDPSTIMVYPNADFSAATYSEGGISFSSKPDRTLQSVCGRDLTIISGGTSAITFGSTNVTVDGFTITGGTSYGVYFSSGSAISDIVKNCIIASNSTGVYLNQTCTATIQDSLIQNNTTRGINSASSSALLQVYRCNISSNGSGGSAGAGISISGGSGTHTLQNTTISNNNSGTQGGGAIYLINGPSVTIQGCTLNGNTASSGGAIYNNSGSPTLNIYDTFIQGNSGTSGGGINVNSGAVNMTNVMLTGNKASGNGGAITEQNGGVINCLFCTVSGNYSGALGGGLYNNTAAASTVRNSIIYNNYDANANTYEQIYSQGSNYTYITTTYTLINQAAGSPGYTDGGGNNVLGNPNFVSPLNPSAAPATGGDYHLQSGSPAINAASSSYPYDHDIFGNSRPLGSGYDMGAHEKQ